MRIKFSLFSGFTSLYDARMTFTFDPIGIIYSCFTEKFTIPRQAGLVPDATAILELMPPFDNKETIRGIEAFSHIWLVFVFHKNLGAAWRPTVRPPRLGGNKRVGVFASRSPFRPNPVGMSSARLEGIALDNGKRRLHLSGLDILNETPVLDIKPYVPYADRHDEATGGFATEPPKACFTVDFTPQALAACEIAEKTHAPNLRDIIRQTLSYDPRPGYYNDCSGKKNTFGTRLYDMEVKWTLSGREIMVYSVAHTQQKNAAMIQNE